MIRYQGEDIDFTIELEKLKSGDIQSFEEFSSIIVYFYTNASYIAKFANPAKSGYSALTINTNGNILSGVIGKIDTKKMLGALYMDILLISNNGQHNNIKNIVTGVQILHAQIKQEINN